MSLGFMNLSLLGLSMLDVRRGASIRLMVEPARRLPSMPQGIAQDITSLKALLRRAAADDACVSISLPAAPGSEL